MYHTSSLFKVAHEDPKCSAITGDSHEQLDATRRHKNACSGSPDLTSFEKVAAFVTLEASEKRRLPRDSWSPGLQHPAEYPGRGESAPLCCLMVEHATLRKLTRQSGPNDGV